MSTAYVECWKCDECGFRWIKTEVWPERCPSRVCRKRSWNHNGESSKRPESEPRGRNTQKDTSSGAGNASDGRLATPTKPDMAALRAICAGAKQVGHALMNPQGRDPVEDFHPSIDFVTPHPDDLCPHKEWLDGEQYRCRLQAGHKGKCAPGERIS